MAEYRVVKLAFWSDTKVVESFTPEDKLFYLYLLTNPHTNLCGCYEISTRQIANEIGYSEDSVKNLLARFADMHKCICYDDSTKEILLFNWAKHNWTSSDKYKKALESELHRIKNKQFLTFLQKILYDEYTVSIPYAYGIDTSIPISSTNTSTISICAGKPNIEEAIVEENSKPSRHKYGEYQNVLLSDKDMEKLKSEFPNDWSDRIEQLSSYMASTGKKYKNHLATIRNWARNESKGGAHNGKYNGNKGNGKDSGESKYAGYEFGTTV